MNFQEVKECIKQFKKNNDESLLETISDYLGYKRCIVTNSPIYYPYTKIRIKKDNTIHFESASINTTKIVNGNVYNLTVSYKGMVEIFAEEYTSTNISRVFNTLNKFTKFAFQISDEDYEIEKKSSAVTLENQIKKYGKIEGTKRFQKYCDRQSYTNTFEYKKKKYGWSEQQFDNYNKSRAVTLDNLILKHGRTKGIDIYQRYIEKQSITSTSEYILHTFGEDRLNEINNAKGHTIEYFIKKYGDIEGTNKYKHHWTTSKVLQYCASNISLNFFNILMTEIDISEEFYLGDNEYGIFDKNTMNYYKYDFTIPILKLIVEFNGDVFHANPKIYKINDRPNPFNREITAGEIWEYDKHKIKVAKKERDFDVIVIWEYDYKNNLDSCIKKVVNEIRNRRNRIN